ncbi:cytochrome P450 [Dichomitus squalens]|nr:cytochrome P450 [Dichomitus squalens]
MTMFPDVQERAQAELDSIVGNEKLTTFADRSSLPYVNAVLKEDMRWQAITPIGVGHRSVADVYAGLLIPGDSLLIPNIWAMCPDEADYPGPERFYPERWLRDGILNPDVRDPLNFAFGFGRRYANCVSALIARVEGLSQDLSRSPLCRRGVVHYLCIRPSRSSHRTSRE